eukprot:jgi/Psemu1/8835/gm1.8835_g
MVSSLLLPTQFKFFSRRGRHSKTNTTEIRRHANQDATKKSVGRKRRSEILAVIFVFFFVTTTSLNHRVHTSMKVEERESISLDAHLVGFPIIDTTALKRTTDAPSDLSSTTDAKHRHNRSVYTIHPLPKSIGSCHNLSWWTGKTGESRSSTSSRNNENEMAHARSLGNRNKPIWIASFPGSGAEMIRQLIESLTGGQPAWSVYTKDNPIQTRTCLEANAATCKTHWPVLSFRPVVFPPPEKCDADKNDREDRMGGKDSSTTNTSTAGSGPNDQTRYYHSQAIVLLRNPISAYPSRLNHQWELKNKVGYHVRQAPENAWNAWIRKTFQHQRETFFDFVVTWAKLSGGIENGDNNNTQRVGRVALFVPYEGLIDPKQGPVWARRIVGVLHQAGTRHASSEVDDEDGCGNSGLLDIDNNLPVPTQSAYYNHDRKDDDIECLLEDAIFDRPLRKRAPHTYQPGYTREQQEELEQMFTDILDHIENTIKSNDGDGSNNNNNNNNNNNEATSITRVQRDLLMILKTYQQSIQNNESFASSQSSLSSIRILQ